MFAIVLAGLVTLVSAGCGSPVGVCAGSARASSRVRFAAARVTLPGAMFVLCWCDGSAVSDSAWCVVLCVGRAEGDWPRVLVIAVTRPSSYFCLRISSAIGGAQALRSLSRSPGGVGVGPCFLATSCR